MKGWMSSPGHRGNIMDPWHRRVNIGIAWDRYNVVMYQHFEGAYVEYNELPTMLTLGQVARTYCYDSGVQVASLREPLSGGYNWTTDRFTTIHDPCPSPYDVPRNSPAPRSPEDAHQLWKQAYAASQSQRDATITVPWITASRWVAGGAEFAVRADIGQILDLHGDGVYSLVVWGTALGSGRGYLRILHIPRTHSSGYLPGRLGGRADALHVSDADAAEPEAETMPN